MAFILFQGIAVEAARSSCSPGRYMMVALVKVLLSARRPPFAEGGGVSVLAAGTSGHMAPCHASHGYNRYLHLTQPAYLHSNAAEITPEGS